MNTLFVRGQLKVLLKSTASYFCVTELKPGAPLCEDLFAPELRQNLFHSESQKDDFDK